MCRCRLFAGSTRNNSRPVRPRWMHVHLIRVDTSRNMGGRCLCVQTACVQAHSLPGHCCSFSLRHARHFDCAALTVNMLSRMLYQSFSAATAEMSRQNGRSRRLRGTSAIPPRPGPTASQKQQVGSRQARKTWQNARRQQVTASLKQRHPKL